MYKIVLETLVEESIDDLSKSDLIDSESHSGVLTEPKVIVQALIELDLSSSNVSNTILYIAQQPDSQIIEDLTLMPAGGVF